VSGADTGPVDRGGGGQGLGVLTPTWCPGRRRGKQTAAPAPAPRTPGSLPPRHRRRPRSCHRCPPCCCGAAPVLIRPCRRRRQCCCPGRSPSPRRPRRIARPPPSPRPPARRPRRRATAQRAGTRPAAPTAAGCASPRRSAPSRACPCTACAPQSPYPRAPRARCPWPPRGTASSPPAALLTGASGAPGLTTPSAAGWGGGGPPRGPPAPPVWRPRRRGVWIPGRWPRTGCGRWSQTEAVAAGGESVQAGDVWGWCAAIWSSEARGQACGRGAVGAGGQARCQGPCWGLRPSHRVDAPCTLRQLTQGIGAVAQTHNKMSQPVRTSGPGAQRCAIAAGSPLLPRAAPALRSSGVVTTGGLAICCRGQGRAGMGEGARWHHQADSVCDVTMLRPAAMPVEAEFSAENAPPRQQHTGSGGLHQPGMRAATCFPAPPCASRIAITCAARVCGGGGLASCRGGTRGAVRPRGLARRALPGVACAVQDTSYSFPGSPTFQPFSQQVYPPTTS
jgi:hypothetical protein